MAYFLLTIVSFLAGLVGELTGFGAATVSMPLLLFLFPIKIVIPLVAITSTLIFSVIAIRIKAKGIYNFLFPLAIGTVIGIPIGMFLLDMVESDLLVFFMAIFLIGYSLYGLFTKERKVSFHNNIIGGMVGIIAGIFSALFNVNGPFIGAYVAGKRPFHPETYKDTVATYAVFCGFFTIIGHLIGGRINGEVLKLLFYSLPGLILGLLFGSKIFNSLSNSFIKKIVYSFVLISGILLLI